MLPHVLAIAVAIGSFGFYVALFIVPEIYRGKADFAWCGLGLFYALVLWVCAGRITGGVLLGQTASVALLGWLGWQMVTLRRQTTAPIDQTTLPAELPPHLTQNPLGRLILRLRRPQAQPETPEAESATAPESKTQTQTEPEGAIATPDVTTEESAAPTAAQADSLVETTSTAATAREAAEPPTTATADNVLATNLEAITTEPPELDPPKPPEPDPILAEVTASEPSPIASADLSDVPEPAVIEDLQALKDLNLPEPTGTSPETTEAEPPAEPEPSAANSPETSAPTAEDPETESQATVFPTAETPAEITVEISTSFADRIMEADFDPDEEDNIVDVEVIRASTAEDKEDE